VGHPPAGGDTLYDVAMVGLAGKYVTPVTDPTGFEIVSVMDCPSGVVMVYE